jgi:hypothetical protein
MAITGEEKKVQEGGEQKDAFVVTFSNGALSQVEELKHFFGRESNLELIKSAISFLQLLKEQEEKKKPPNH